MTKDSRQYEARMFGVHQRVMMFLLFCAVTMSAQTPCTVTLPITVIVRDGTIVKHLPPESLVTNTIGISLQPDFAADDSKRRILIVLDGSPELENTSLEAEKWMARTLVDNARPGDSFALISGNASPVRVQFGADNASVLKALDDFSIKSRKGKELGLYDAINEGLAWFGTPEFGNSVLLLPGSSTASVHGSTGFSVPGEECGTPFGCRPMETYHDTGPRPDFSKVESKIKPKELDDALVGRGVRLFVSGQVRAIARQQIGISVETGGFPFIYPEAERQRSKAGNDILIYPRLKGGWVHPASGGGKKIFQLDDSTRSKLTAEALKIYGAIALIYRVSVRSSEDKQIRISLYLRPEITSKLPTAIALHPILLPACTSK